MVRERIESISDDKLLMSVGELIDTAIGLPEENKVNFKLVQDILHIFARQLSMLEIRVEVRISELPPKKVVEPEKEEPTKESILAELERAATKDWEKKSRSASKERAKAELAVKKEVKQAAKDIEREAKLAEKAKKKEENALAKDKEKAEKADAKEKDKKDKEKRQKSKDREKGDKASSKAREKEEKTTAKEREKGDKPGKEEKVAPKEKEKEATKGQEKEDKATILDKEKEEMKEKRDKAASKAVFGKEKEEEGLTKEKRDVAASKVVFGKEKEVEGKEKILPGKSVVIKEQQHGKQKAPVDTQRRDAAIDVVTLSEFQLLEGFVKELAKKVGPTPMPTMPDNEKLRSEIARGASLPDTMQAMQITARVNAAEQGINRMADLLTQLAASGALPQDIANKVNDVKHDLEDEMTMAAEPTGGKSQMTPKSMPRTTSVMSRMSMASMGGGMHAAQVTHQDMKEAFQDFKNDIMQNAQIIFTSAASAADNAMTAFNAASEKMDEVLKLDSRLSKMKSLISDYAEQLNGFDAGLGIQLIGFQEQIKQIRNELSQGLNYLENVNSNNETAAVTGLRERYQGLADEMEEALGGQMSLTDSQRDLSANIHLIKDTVEVLRELKADRDEVLDNLRDKADGSRLALLSRAEDFEVVQAELEQRLEVCSKKFDKQDSVWKTVIKDLTEMFDTKTAIAQMSAMQQEVEVLLDALNDKCLKVAIKLGKPKTLISTRHISSGGIGKTSGVMDIPDARWEAKPRLYASRPRPLGAEEVPSLAAGEPCFPAVQSVMSNSPNDRVHCCYRWVGGSHTMISNAVTRQQAEPLDVAITPTKKYTALGKDGRTYKMEEDLQPCVECNMISEEPQAAVDGGGDRGEPVDRARR